MSLRSALEELVEKYRGDYYLETAGQAIDDILDAHPEPEGNYHWWIKFGCGEMLRVDDPQVGKKRMEALAAEEGTCLPMSLVKRRYVPASYGPWEAAG